MAANTSKTPAAERRQQLLAVALQLAEEYGFQRVSSEAIGDRAGCSSTLVRQHWTTARLHDDIMREAVRLACLPVLAQGLVFKHPIALDAPLDLRVRAAEAMVTP